MALQEGDAVWWECRCWGGRSTKQFGCLSCTVVSRFPDLATVSKIVWANIPYACISTYTSDAGTAELKCKREEVKVKPYFNDSLTTVVL